jgi:hypothetical protein
MKKKWFSYLVIISLFLSCSDDNTSNVVSNGGGNQSGNNGTTDKIYTGFVFLESQGEVNGFASQNYTKIYGNFFINGTSITDISGLSSIKEIYGDLKITNTSLTNLDGLSNLKLTKIGDNCSIDIYGNNLLENIDGLKEIDIKITYLQILNNENLINLNGLSNIPEFYDVLITECPKLTNLNGFLGVDKYIQNFRISRTGVTDVSGLKHVPSMGYFNFSENDSISSLLGLDNLKQLDHLLLSENDNLIDINGLSGLESCNSLTIQSNDKLMNLDGLMNLNYVNSGSVRVTLNSSLNDFCGLTLLSNTTTMPGFNIWENLYNPTKADIINGSCSN